MLNLKQCAQLIGQPDNLGTLSDEEYYSNNPCDILPGRLGMRCKITDAGPRKTIAICKVFGPKKTRKPPTKTGKETSPEQMKANIRNSFISLINILAINISILEGSHIVFTCAKVNASLDTINYYLKECIKKINKTRKEKGLPEIVWVKAVGYGDCRTHIHLVTNVRLSKKEWSDAWGRGTVSVYSVDKYGKGLVGMAAYLIKQSLSEKRKGNRKFCRMWTASRNCKKPKTRTIDSNMSIRELKLHEKDIMHDFPQACKEWFPGFRVDGIRIAYPKWPREDIPNIYCTLSQVVYPLPFHQSENASVEGIKGDGIKKKQVTVNYDYMFEFEGVYYSMPGQYIKKKIYVIGTPDTVEVYDQGVIIREHIRPKTIKRYVIIPGDIPDDPGKYSIWTTPYFLNWAGCIGPNTKEYIKWCIAHRQYPVEAYRGCMGVLQLAKKYNKYALEMCCEKALKVNNYKWNYVKRNIKECYQQWSDSLVNGKKGDNVLQTTIFDLLLDDSV